MFCMKCGKKIEEDSNFCPVCGTKVGCVGNALGVQTKVKTPRFSNNRVIFFLTGGLGLCVAIISAIVGINMQDGISDDGDIAVSVSKKDDKALKAYRKYADSMEYEASYYLTDMDDDSVPECIVFLYAPNGKFNYPVVLGYKNHTLLETRGFGGSNTSSSYNGIQDGTVFWYPDIDYFAIYTNSQTWWGDLLKEDQCSWRIFSISNFESRYVIIATKDNNDTTWHYSYSAYDTDGEVHEGAEEASNSVFAELSDSVVYNKMPTRYVTLEEAIEDYLSR